MRYFIIAGEASGDLHAGNLVKEIKKIDSKAEFAGFGGDLMQREGVAIFVHYREMAFMGAFEVLMNLRTIDRNFKICEEKLLEFNPHAIILVDYAGFNLRMAKFAKSKGIKTLFYISPKVWAWKKSRVKKIKAFVDQLYLILPFEKEYFSKKNFTKTFYAGNPVNDAIEDFLTSSKIDKEEFLKKNNLNNKPIIALLAGSRKQEIKRLLPLMIKVIPEFNNFQFVIAGAPSIDPDYYKPFIDNKQVSVVFDQTYQLLSHAHTALVTSGTATLETALFNVPQVVLYKFQTLSFLIFRPFIWVKYFSLVNIIMNKTVVQELLQFSLVKKAKIELHKLTDDGLYRTEMFENYKLLQNNIGKPGTSHRAAEHICNYLIKAT